MSLAVVFNGRRKTVKVTPNTTMQAVLEMACAEHDIKDSSGYCLMHKKSAIDPSQPFRFTGIPNNATVDLVEQKGRVEQKVRLAVQVAGGRRIQGNYDPSVSLWDVIGQAVADGQLDRAYVEQESVVVYLRQSFQGQATLTETTLRSMGLVSGSALLNLRLASGEVPGGQASVPAPGSSASTDSGVEESKFSTQRPVPSPPAMAAMPPPAPVNMDVATVAAPAPPQPAPPTATPMSVCSSGQSTPMEVAEPPTMGFSAAQDALETMQTRCFESDLKETVALLAKYIDNIVGKPNEPKTRAIKCSNAHFQQKVAPRPGGQEFLMALGFKEEQRGLTHEIAKDPLGHTFLVPNNYRYNSELQVSVGCDLLAPSASPCSSSPPDLMKRRRLTAQEQLKPYILAAGTAALFNFPLWKATAIRQSGFALPQQGGGSLLMSFLEAYKPPYRGILAAWFGMTWARAAIFGGSEAGKRLLQERFHMGGVAASALPALVMASSVQCVNTPLFKATVALQDPRCPHRTVRASVRAIWREHGLRGLFHGTSAGVLKTAPKYGVAVLVKDQVEDYYHQHLPPPASRKEALGRAACKAVVAGLASAVLCNPFDVLRNTMFRRPQASLRQSLAFLVQTEGVGFAVRGLQNNVLSICIPIALTIFLTDVYKRLLLAAPPTLPEPNATTRLGATAPPAPS